MTCRNFNRPALSEFGYTVYTGDGATATYSIPWDYVTKPTVTAGASTLDISVWVNNVQRTYVLASSSTLTISFTPAVDDFIEIIRESQLASPLVEWTNDTKVDEENLGLMNLQHQYLIQEMWSRIRGLECAFDEDAEPAYINRYLFTGNGSTLTYSLQPETQVEEDLILVTFNGVVQHTDTYSAAETGGFTSVTLSEAPASGTKIVFIVIGSKVVNYNIPDDYITTSMLQDGAVTFGKINFDAVGTNGQALMKRSGSAIFSTILPADVSGFDTQVRTNRLSQMAAPTASVAMNSQLITGVSDPVSAQDAATKNYVDTELADVRVSKGTATLDVISAGVNSAVTVIGLTFPPRVVQIYWLAVNKGSSNLYDTQVTFSNAASTETRRSLTIRHSDGSSLTVSQQLIFTSDGFTYTVNFQNTSDYSGTIRYIAYP